MFCKVFLVAILFFLVNNSFAQQANLAPMSGSAPSSFGVSPDQLGSIEKTLNLFTGDIQFPLNLINLPGRNGLDVNITIAYNSNVLRQVNTWNMEAPTGILGLGWSMEYPKIIVDNKMTGTREDDTYYLSEGSSTNKLYYVSSNGSNKLYQTKNYQFWQITFFPDLEKWEIVKEDGSKYTYGDKNSGRSTVQWIVHFNNWMGNSNVTDATIQKQQGLIWNLSEVKNIWGEKITFSYTNTEQNVGGTAGKLQTEASFLSSITDVDNNIVSFTYAAKQSSEYQEPHTENGNGVIDAYQERYETKFLDYITVTNPAGLQLNKIDLDYSSIGSGNLQKRLLTSITQYNSQNHSLPGYKFSYLTTYDPYSNTGALTQITSPLKGTISFTYNKATAARSVRDKIVATVAGYAEPKIWIGSDYVVVTRRQLSNGVHTTSARNVMVQVFNWDGEWIEWDRTESLTGVTVVQDDGSSSNLTDQIPDYQNFFVTLQNGFFAILSKPDGSPIYTLNIFRKNDVSRNGWSRYQYNTALASSNIRQISLVSGENFVAMCGDKSHILTFTWNGTDWGWKDLVRFPGYVLYNPVVAGPNYIISHNRYGTDNSTNPVTVYNDVITFYFLKEDGTWLQKTAPSLPDNQTGDKSYWHAGSSFAVAMADDNAEHFYNWDDSYNITKTSSGLSLPDNSYVDITGNSMVSIVTIPGSGGGYVARFNGKNWNVAPNMDYYGSPTNVRSLFSFGDDFVIRPRGNDVSSSVAMKSFNPNTNTWVDSNYPSYNSQLVFGGYNYFLMVDPADYHTANLYYRNPNGSFIKDPTSFTGLQNTQSGLTESRFGWLGGTDFVIKQTNRDADYVCDLETIRFKNGSINPTRIGFTHTNSNIGLLASDGTCEIMYPLNNFDPTPVMVNGNTIALFSDELYQFDATEVRLFRLIDTDASGPLADFNTQIISVFDGTKPMDTSIQFDNTTATYDPTGTICQYSKVTVYPGTPDNRSGNTQYFFFNGLKNIETGGLFPTEGMNYETNNKLALGVSYRKRVYNSTDQTPVAESVSAYNMYQMIATNGSFGNTSYFLRTLSVLQTQDGASNYTSFDYNLSNGQVLRQKSYSKSSNGTLYNNIFREYKYWYEVYDPTLSKHILINPIQAKRIVNGQTTEVSATRWKNWSVNNVPASYQTYAWKRNGPPDFSAWDISSSPLNSDWKLTSTTNSMDEIRGFVKEIVDKSGRTNSTIYSFYHPYVFAEVFNAASSQILYEGFEDATQSFSTDAKTGTKSFTNQFGYTVNVPSQPGSYRLTYWKKIGAGNWQLMEQDLSSTTTIGTETGALIDEVRVHPITAAMTTYAYDNFGNLITMCDDNNNVIYKEYDEFNREIITRDTDRNILSRMKYIIKQ